MKAGDIIVVKRYRGTDDYTLYRVSQTNGEIAVGYSYFDTDTSESVVLEYEVDRVLSFEDRVACAKHLFEVALSMEHFKHKKSYVSTYEGNVFFEKPPNLLTLCITASRFLEKNE